VDIVDADVGGKCIVEESTIIDRENVVVLLQGDVEVRRKREIRRQYKRLDHARGPSTQF
jgi:hypothetical protein